MRDDALHMHACYRIDKQVRQHCFFLFLARSSLLRTSVYPHPKKLIFGEKYAYARSKCCTRGITPWPITCQVQTRLYDEKYCETYYCEKNKNCLLLWQKCQLSLSFSLCRRARASNLPRAIIWQTPWSRYTSKKYIFEIRRHWVALLTPSERPRENLNEILVSGRYSRIRHTTQPATPGRGCVQSATVGAVRAHAPPILMVYLGSCSTRYILSTAGYSQTVEKISQTSRCWKSICIYNIYIYIYIGPQKGQSILRSPDDQQTSSRGKETAAVPLTHATTIMEAVALLG